MMNINLPENLFIVFEHEQCTEPGCVNGRCGCVDCLAFMFTYHEGALMRYDVPEDACRKCFGTGHPVLTKAQGVQSQKQVRESVDGIQNQPATTPVAEPDVVRYASKHNSTRIPAEVVEESLGPITYRTKLLHVIDCTLHTRDIPRPHPKRPIRDSAKVDRMPTKKEFKRKR